MRVLSILPFPVLPLAHGGRVRAYRLAVGLARAGATVELACPWQPNFPRGPFRRDGITIRPFVHAANVVPKLVTDRIVPSPLQLSFQPRTLGPRRLIRRACLYDIVEFHLCPYARWMTHVARETRVVYSAHNVEFDYVLAASPPRLARIYSRMIRTLEHRAVRASDLVVTSTEADERRLDELYGGVAESVVVHNGFDEEEMWGGAPPSRDAVRTELGIAPDELAILFVGGRALHNQIAVQYLENELLPRLARPARLIVAGQCAAPRRAGAMLALGFVESLVPLLAAADVAVNPVAAGSGSNIKLAEYLAAGLPVVTTPFGLRGYEAFAALVTIAGLDDFPRAVQNVRRVAGRRADVAALGWTALGVRLYEGYVELVGRVRPRSAAG